MAELSERIARLSRQQRSRLADRLSRLAVVADFRPSAPAASSEGRERLIAYVVAEPEVASGEDELRSSLQAKLPSYMVPSTIQFLDSLPLTPNGKLDRRALPAPREQAKNGRPADNQSPRGSRDQILTRIWEEVLGLDRVELDDDFFEVGGDSLLSIRIIARAHQAGLRLTPNQIFDHPTIAELAAVAEDAGSANAEQGLVTGPAPLTPIQHWFFEQAFTDPHYWNQALLLSAPTPVDPALLEEALQRLLLHHDALRSRYRQTATGWEQLIAGAEMTLSLTRVDLRQVPPERQEEELARRAEEIQASLTLSKGPLFRAALFELTAPQPVRLLLVAHHLVIDPVSWPVLLEDLERLYDQLAQGHPPKLPEKTSSYQGYAQQLYEYAKSDALETDRAYWLSTRPADPVDLPFDHSVDDPAAPPNTVEKQRTIEHRLSIEETRSLLEVPGHYRIRVDELLIAALAAELAGWTQRRSILLGLEGHGRQEIDAGVDLSRTVGWFTSFFPVVLSVDPQVEPEALLTSVKEQLRRVPNRGLSFGVLRYLSPDSRLREQLATLPRPQVLFNYLGQTDGAEHLSARFARAPESVGLSRNPRNQQPFLLEINAERRGGRLQVRWTYSSQIFEDATIERLASGFRQRLKHLIKQCLSSGTRGFAPSDFPLTPLTTNELDQILAHTARTTGLRDGLADIYGLSPMQELMLLSASTAPRDDVLLTQIHYTLRGVLDVETFRAAWQRVLERHDALRTAFLWDNLSRPVQIVFRQSELPFVFVDLRQFPTAERGTRFEELRRADEAARFALTRPPLMRITLVRMEEERHELLWTSHHLVMDRWCIEVVVQEMAAIYRSLCQRTAPLLESAPQFRDYIAWIGKQDEALAMEIWRKNLPAGVEPTRLPVDDSRGHPNAAGPQHRELHLTMADSVSTQVRSLAQQNQLTVNTVLQGAWALSLGLSSGQGEVILGVTVSGRPAEIGGIEKVVGSFVNNLPLRVSISPLQVVPWLKRIQEQQGALRAVEHSSLVRIHQWTGLPETAALFQTLVIFQSDVADRLRVDEQLVLHSDFGGIRTRYPLTLVAMERDHALYLALVYDSHRLSEEAVATLGDTLVGLLSEIATCPDRVVTELEHFKQPAHLPRMETPNAATELRRDPDVASDPTAQSGYRAPRDVLEHQLVMIWEKILGVEQIGIRDNFFLLGGDSLSALRLFAHLEDAFGQKLPATLLTQAGTVEQLAELMRRREQASLAPVAVIQSGGSGRPLFYISPLGAQMLSFAYFVHHLGADRPVYGLQPLGLQGDGAPLFRAEDIASHFVREIRSIQAAGPYLLTGTCFGGIVAVEVARQLQAAGDSIAFLGLFDTPFPDPTPSSKLRWHIRELARREPKERLDYVVERIMRRLARAVGPLYLQWNRPLPARLQSSYAQAGVAHAVNAYIPQHYAGKITLFRAEATVASNENDETVRGWGAIATDGVEVHLVPGEHGTMMSEPYVHVLVRQFRSCLDGL